MGRRERDRPFFFISRSSLPPKFLHPSPLPAVPFVTFFVADGIDCDIACNTITSDIKEAAVMFPAESDQRADGIMTRMDDSLLTGQVHAAAGFLANKENLIDDQISRCENAIAAPEIAAIAPLCRQNAVGNTGGSNVFAMERLW